LLTEGQKFTMSARELPIPRTAKQALEQPHWKAAMKEEFDALIRNQTWKLVPRTTRDRIINTQWVFRVKQAEDGKIERCKARLVANGLRQVEGCDYTHTFSPVVRANSVRTVLTIAISKKWDIKQIDVSNAFLHGRLDEKVIVTQPKGFEDPRYPDHVCLLQRALYGLKQSPRMWYRRLRDFLVKIKFRESYSDPSLFIYNHHNEIVYLFAYVDDIVVTG